MSRQCSNISRMQNQNVPITSFVQASIWGGQVNQQVHGVQSVVGSLISESQCSRQDWQIKGKNRLYFFGDQNSHSNSKSDRLSLSQLQPKSGKSSNK